MHQQLMADQEFHFIEGFSDLFEKNAATLEMRPGMILEGLILRIDTGRGIVTVDTPLKSEAHIKIEEFLDQNGQLEIAVGSLVPVALEAVEDGWGETRLSRIRAKRQEAWIFLEKAQQDGKVVKGVIHGKVKGGFTVDLNGIRAFLPGSLVDVRPVRDTGHLEGRELDFRVIKLDQKRNNVVVSRRQVMETENSAERDALLESLQEWQVVKGVVKNLTDYGAFIDLGGIDGLLHITDIAWRRVKHPSEVLNVGEEITVRVLKYDKEKMRVSLGLKQLGDDPWVGIARRYPVNMRLFGKVTNIRDYGCFVELEEGIEGLVHVSEMDWTNRNVHPSRVVTLMEEIEVIVLEVDEERRRISLGLKQCKESPWQSFASKFKKGEKIKGKIKSITDFGIFIGLEGGIDGLVHLSDISWETPGEEAVKQYKKNDEIEAVVLSIDPERERISLGVKQLEDDGFGAYISENPKGAIVKGIVRAIEPKSATLELASGIEGTLKAAEASRDKIEDLNTILKLDDELEVKIISIDKKNRAIQLSVKAKEVQEEAQVMKEFTDTTTTGGTLGDLLREQMQDRS